MADDERRDGNRLPLAPLRGRGAARNPGSRFDRLQYDPDPDAFEPEDALDKETRYLSDRSRSVISRNNSPDIPFDISLNPYRGCSHGCSYCVSGGTPVLMADGSRKAIESVTVGERILGTETSGDRLILIETPVLDHWSTYRRAYGVSLEDGTQLIASGDHRFLSDHGWLYVSGGEQARPHLAPGVQLVPAARLETPAMPSGIGSSTREGPTPDGAASLKRVIAVEDLGVEIPMFDITTGTGDFIADGVVSHNCYARPSHEYLGFSPGLDFERMIMVKEDAPALLEKELRKPNWEPETMLLSGVTDPYQPVERKLKLTRACLEVLRDFRHPVSVITKNHLVTRDIDLLAELAEYDAAHVTLSVTTLNEELRRRMEPRTSTGQRRVDAVRELSDAGIPVSVNIAPIIPGLNDEEIPGILSAVAEAGAKSAHFILVRLPGAVEGIFLDWLEAHYPERKEKVLGRLRQARGGKLNEAAFGKRMRGEGPYAESVRTMFHVNRKRRGLSERSFVLSGDHFRVPGSDSQPSLFEKPTNGAR